MVEQLICAPSADGECYNYFYCEWYDYFFVQSRDAQFSSLQFYLDTSRYWMSILESYCNNWSVPSSAAIIQIRSELPAESVITTPWCQGTRHDSPLPRADTTRGHWSKNTYIETLHDHKREPPRGTVDNRGSISHREESKTEWS